SWKSSIRSRQSTPVIPWRATCPYCWKSSATSGATSGCSTIAGRATSMRAPKASETEHNAVTDKVRARMTDRVWFVGSNAATAPQIEGGFAEMLELLDAHLATRPYLFGGRPAYGDFGLWGQFYELWKDPTTGALIEGGTPN